VAGQVHAMILKVACRRRWGLMPFARHLPLWVLAGVALDAAVLIGIWMLLDAAGPLTHNTEYLLDSLGFVSVPWVVHVVVLPIAFRITSRTWIEKGCLLIRTVAFTALALMLIPFVGITVFMMLGTFIIIATGANLRMTVGSLTWADKVLDDAFWTVVAIIVGTAIGLMLHMLRRAGAGGRNSTRTLQPSIRSDLVGAAIAALLAFGGMFIALPLGVFTRPVNIAGDWMHEMSTVPQLSATVIIGVVALLPHLLMVGNDLLSSDLRAEEKRTTE
jgi:hypothetical protein